MRIERLGFRSARGLGGLSGRGGGKGEHYRQHYN